jgi:hypothetical protein
MFSNFFPENRTVYEIMSKNMPINFVTIWRTRVACCISKAKCTYAHAPAHAHTGQYVILLSHGNNESQTCHNVTLYVHCLFFFL